MSVLNGLTPASTVEGLYRAHHPWLHSWLRRKLGCTEQAADLAQDVFIRLLRREHPAVLDEPRAYLTVIARGLVIEHWRRRDLERAWLELLAQLPEALAPSPEERQIYLDALLALDRMLDGLKPKVRQALILARIDGLSCPKIAVQLGVSLATAERYLATALKHCYALRFEPLSMANRAPLIAPEIVDAAVSWAVRIEFGEPDASTRQAFEDWIRADSRHQEAWRRVASLGDDIPQVPAALATATLQRRQRLQAGRRNALKLLGTTGALVLAAWSAPQTPVWQRRFADQATNVGQRQRLALAGNARLDLNTDTAVDLPFGPQGNTLRLRRGEIRVDNRAEGAAAIAIQTPLGWLQSSVAALVLRLQQGMLRIDLLAGQAQLQGNQGRVTLTPGQPLLVSADDSVALPPPRFTVDGWIDGVLSVHDMPLGEVVDELARYTRRWLRCDPALVQRRISGILHIDQIDDALAHLAASQGLQLQRRFGVWTLTEKN